MKYKKKYLIIHSLIPLVIGSLIYILFRSDKLIYVKFLKMISCYDIFIWIRNYSYSYNIFLPNILLYSLPNSLWVYSFTSIMLFIWFDAKVLKIYKLWILVPIFLNIGTEFGQYFKYLPGTFDYSDIILSLAAFFISIYLYIITFRGVYNENSQ